MTPVSRTKYYAPIREFYIRTDAHGVLDGPYTYAEADSKARTVTKEAAKTGVGSIHMEMVQIVGSRLGDPPVTPSDRVICAYLAGRKTIGGRLAQYNSDHGKDTSLI
jgi:hypothetical protein